MIGIDYTGRLGNQLFTYAFMRCLIEKRQIKEESIIANFKRSMSGSKEEGFEDSLRHFNVLSYQKKQYDLVLHNGSIVQKTIYLLYMLCWRLPFLYRNNSLMTTIERWAEKYGLFFSGAADKAHPISSLHQKILFIRGYFEDKGYFDTIRPILLKEFTPKESPLPQNAALYEAAARTNSVCISVRRGDYLNEENRKNFFMCDEAYFRKAIQVICEKVENPILIFFSNDIQWVREHLRFNDLECYYESGNDPVWETLRLMYSCQHFIISNSTFSWWAQYLGRRDDKIVISPSHWFANPQWNSNLIDSSFITIS